MIVEIACGVSGGIWVYLLLGRGGFWRVSRAVLRGSAVRGTPRVVAVIPARDEALTIGQTIESLLQQAWRVVVVDDGSSDGTAEVARLAAERAGVSSDLRVITGEPLTAGWTGKLWALRQGIQAANEWSPDFLLLTDADIAYEAGTVSELVGFAQDKELDLASLMVMLACETASEKALIPAFVFFFLQLYPPAWIRSEKHRTAGAAGGCVLIRPEALRRAGGLESIRSEVIDDCALARAVKRSGGRIWLGLTGRVHSLRSYATWQEMARMIARTAFSQLKHSGWLLVATLAGLFFTYLIPVAGVLTLRARPAALGAGVWLLMAALYRPMVRWYGRNLLWALTLPFVALFYSAVTAYSAILYWRGRGGEWKGRMQDVRAAAR